MDIKNTLILVVGILGAVALGIWLWKKIPGYVQQRRANNANAPAAQTAANSGKMWEAFSKIAVALIAGYLAYLLLKPIGGQIERAGTSSGSSQRTPSYDERIAQLGETELEDLREMITDRLHQAYEIPTQEITDLFAQCDKLPDTKFRNALLREYGIHAPDDWGDLPSHVDAIPEFTTDSSGKRVRSSYFLKVKVTKGTPSRAFNSYGWDQRVRPDDPTAKTDVNVTFADGAEVIQGVYRKNILFLVGGTGLVQVDIRTRPMGALQISIPPDDPRTSVTFRVLRERRKY